MLELSSPKISAARKTVIATMITDIAIDTFTEQSHAEYWFALLATESGFDGTGKSHVGATGIGQLMPQYVADFGRQCGLPTLTVADIKDDYTNARVSACLFASLIEQSGGSIPLALAYYNAGKYGTNAAKVRVGEAPGTETAGYVTKVWRKRDIAAPNQPTQ